MSKGNTMAPMSKRFDKEKKVENYAKMAELVAEL